jgi:hypothetical protein
VIETMKAQKVRILLTEPFYSRSDAEAVAVFGVMLVVCTAARRIFYHTVVDAR